MPQLQELSPKIVAGTALRGCQTIRGRTERKLQANSRARSVPARRDDRIRRRQLSLQRFPRDDLAEFDIRGVSTCDAFAEPWYNVSVFILLCYSLYRYNSYLCFHTTARYLLQCLEI